MKCLFETSECPFWHAENESLRVLFATILATFPATVVASLMFFLLSQHWVLYLIMLPCGYQKDLRKNRKQ